MPRYNLAYSPSDPIFAATCTAFAGSHFGDLADGACLNPSHALPHVTLSQFVTEPGQIDFIWERAQSLCTATYDISFVCADLRPGTGIHTGYVWAELVVERAPELVATQKNIALMLVDAGIEPLTQSNGRYLPHLTFARLKKVPQAGMPPWPDKADLKRPHRFHLGLGLADENGVYLETLKS